MTPPAATAVVVAPAAATTPAATATPAAAAPVAATVQTQLAVIRIDAGASAAYTNAAGEVWLADQGFEGGDSADRGSDLQITNTTDSTIYRTEHYGMTSFSQSLPNGKYTVKLHFAETYDGISGPGERVFSVKVGEQEFKDFDPYVKAGGPNRAYVETVTNVDVTNGKLDIIFTEKVENPEINGIEIIPAP
jgi:endoglucanase